MARELITRIHDPASGDLRLDLNASTGYRRIGELRVAGVTWGTQDVRSQYADGDDEVSAAKESLQASLALRVVGSSMLQVDERVEALLAAVDGDWAYVQGWTEGAVTVTRTWLARRADVTPSLTRDDLALGQQTVVLSFKVQPNPTRTVVGGP